MGAKAFFAAETMSDTERCEGVALGGAKVALEDEKREEVLAIVEQVKWSGSMTDFAWRAVHIGQQA